jgi:hypothetical protein
MPNKIKHFYIIKTANNLSGKNWYNNSKFLIANYDYNDKLWLLEKDHGYKTELQATIRPNMISEYIEFLFSQEPHLGITFANNLDDIESNNIMIYKSNQINDIKKCINMAYKIAPNI